LLYINYGHTFARDLLWLKGLHDSLGGDLTIRFDVFDQAVTQRSQTTTMSGNPSFIVVFKDGVSKEQIKEYAEKVKHSGGKVTHELDLINGFAADIPQNFLNNLQSDSLIKYVEPNGEVTTQ